MKHSQTVVLIPGLLCTARLFAAQLPALWEFGPVTVADHRRQETMSSLAQSVLENAPPEFALVGLSMGGYLAFEIQRQAPGRVKKLALLDTSARPDTPEQTQSRNEQIEIAGKGGLDKICHAALPTLLHRSGDPELKEIILQMGEATGAEAFIRQQRAIMGRADSRPSLGAIGCPTLVLVGEEDRLTPPTIAEEIAAGIPGSRYVVVPQCGHASTIEKPGPTTAALVDWLRI